MAMLVVVSIGSIGAIVDAAGAITGRAVGNGGTTTAVAGAVNGGAVASGVTDGFTAEDELTGGVMDGWSVCTSALLGLEVTG